MHKPKHRASWKNREIASVLGIGEKVRRLPESGSLWPKTHQRDLYLKLPTPGMGFFLRTIREASMRCGCSFLMTSASLGSKTCTAPKSTIDCHSLSSDFLKPSKSSADAFFKLNSLFFGFTGFAKKQLSEAEGFSCRKERCSKWEIWSCSTSWLLALAERSAAASLGAAAAACADEDEVASDFLAILLSLSSLFNSLSASLSSLLDSRASCSFLLASRLLSRDCSMSVTWRFTLSDLALGVEPSSLLIDEALLETGAGSDKGSSMEMVLRRSATGGSGVGGSGVSGASVTSLRRWPWPGPDWVSGAVSDCATSSSAIVGSLRAVTSDFWSWDGTTSSSASAGGAPSEATSTAPPRPKRLCWRRSRSSPVSARAAPMDS